MWLCVCVCGGGGGGGIGGEPVRQIGGRETEYLMGPLALAKEK